MDDGTQQSVEIGELAAALAKTQASMRSASKDALNPHLKSKYADLTSVVAAIQPELGNNGLALLQTAETAPDGTVHLATTLAHTSGQWLRGRLRVDVEASRGLNAAQALGLALTYARRYSIAAMVCVCTEDDDGQGAGPAHVPRGTRQADPAKGQGELVRAVPGGEQEGGEAPDPEKQKGSVPYFRFLQKVALLKEKMGEVAYYEVLRGFDLNKSNEVDANDIDTMTLVYRALSEWKEPKK